MLLYRVSVLRSGGTARTHRMLDSAPEYRVYQRRRTSRFKAIHHRFIIARVHRFATWALSTSLLPLGSPICPQVLSIRGPKLKSWQRRGNRERFPSFHLGTAIHFQNKSPPIWNDLGHIPDVLSTPRKPCTPKGTIVGESQGAVSLTVVALGASYAGKSKTRHVPFIHSAHTTYYFIKATEQFTSSWKNFPRVGGLSSSKGTRAYCSLHISSVLCINSDALETSIVRRIAFESLCALLLISASQLNSFFTADLYTLPRLAVLRDHEHKACASFSINLDCGLTVARLP
jgi:hypothetical protein